MGKFYVFFYVFLTVSVVLNAFALQAENVIALHNSCSGNGDCDSDSSCCDEDVGGGCCPKDYSLCCADGENCCPGASPICCKGLDNNHFCCSDESFCCLGMCCQTEDKKTVPVQATKRLPFLN